MIMGQSTIKIKPWCPFCGQVIAKPQPPPARKLGEFAVGSCQCGAVYASDPTGHNVGAAMVDCLVHACNDDWDLAWELIPEEDYLTGRLENYDEQTNQVAEKRNIDGRLVRGVIYFIRLHQAVSEIVARSGGGNKSGEMAITDSVKGGATPAIEPDRDPKRERQRATKAKVKDLVEAEDVDGLVDLCFDDNKTLRLMQRLLFTPDEEKRWLTAHILGEVCGRVSTRKPSPVSTLLHGLFESCSDSAASNWGAVEAIGEIIAARPDLFGAFTRYLLGYFREPSTRVQVLWAMGTIAGKRPKLIRSMPFYELFDSLESPDPLVRAYGLRLVGRMGASEVRSRVVAQENDKTPVLIYEQGRPFETEIAQLASAALKNIDEQGEGKSE